MEHTINRKEIEKAERLSFRVPIRNYRYQKYGGRKPRYDQDSLVYKDAQSIVNKVSLALRKLYNISDTCFPSRWISRDEPLLLITEGCWFKVVMGKECYESDTISDDYYYQLHPKALRY